MAKYQHTASETQIMRAIATMPFGALVTSRMNGSKVGMSMDRQTPIDNVQIAEYLRALGEVLREYVEAEKERDARLREVEDAVRGFGNLLRLAGARASIDHEVA